MRRAVFLWMALCSTSVCLFGQAASGAVDRSGTRPCSLFHPSSDTAEAVTAADLFRAYDSQVRLVRTLHMVGSLSGTAYGVARDPLTLAAIIDLVQPDLIRIRGIVQYGGSRAVELTSDGHQFGLLIPEGNGKVFLAGPIDAPPNSTNPKENLRPRPFIEALRWEEGTPRAETSADPAASGNRVLTIDVAPTEITPSRKVDVVFDLASGVVSSLTAYDSSGARIFEARYSDWRTATDPSSGVPIECFARHIVLDDLQQDYQVDLRISDLTLNATIPKSYFRPAPPRGVPIKHLDMAGGRRVE
jgi:hypothetical protein